MRSVIPATPPLPHYLNVDGVHVRVKLIVALRARETMTVEALVRPATVGQEQQTLVSMGNPDVSGFSFSFDKDGRLVFEA